jgi:hypothetical protein
VAAHGLCCFYQLSYRLLPFTYITWCLKWMKSFPFLHKMEKIKHPLQAFGIFFFYIWMENEQVLFTSRMEE